jgi:hypothetical protein
MSFRARLRLFFVLIVILPMIALGVVLFGLTARSEIAKADAGIAAAMRTTIGLYGGRVDRARPELRRLARDAELRSAVAAGDDRAARRRLRELIRGEVVEAELWSRGQLLARAAAGRGIAAAGSELGASGVVLSVSVTRASDFADRAETLTELHVVVVRGSEALASTLPEGAALLAERMRESIEALHIPQVGGSGTLSVTASFGVASLPESAGPHRADRRR